MTTTHRYPTVRPTPGSRADFAALREFALAHPLTNQHGGDLTGHHRDLPGGIRIILTANN